MVDIYNLHEYGLDVENREIFLYSNLDKGDENSGIEHKMAITFIKNLRILHHYDKEKPIVVHMHSNGGDWNDGLSIIDAVKLSKCPVTIIAYAQAFSMSSVVLQAGDRRIATPNCDFMLHFGSISFDNTPHAAKSAVDNQVKACNKMVDMFVERATTGAFFKNTNKSKIKKFFIKNMEKKVDWYLNPEEAFAYGLVDGILGQGDYLTIEDCKINKKYGN